MNTSPAVHRLNTSPAVRRGYLLIVLAASLWGLIGVYSRYIGKEGVRPIEIAFWRAALSGVLFGLRSRRERARPVLRADLPRVFAFAALGVALFYGSFNLAIDAGGLSLATVLLYSAPAFVALLAWPMLGERPTLRTLGMVAVVLVGVALVAAGSGTGVVVSPGSVAWGLSAGFGYSSFYWLAKPLITTYSTATIFAYAMPIGALLLLPFVDFRDKSATAWAWLAALVLFSTFGAYLAYGLGIRVVDGSRAVLVATVEPVVAVVLAAVLFGERFGLRGVLGSACILAAAFFAARPASAA